jgi:hypothetical protein
LGEKTLKSLHVTWVLAASRAIGGIMVPAVNENHEQHRLVCPLDRAPGDGQLSAVPKITFLVEFDKGEAELVTGGFQRSGRLLLAGKLAFVNVVASQIETVRTVFDATRQHKNAEEGDGEAWTAKGG